MVKAGILTEITPNMETLERLNSFVAVKKPNGNLRVCLNPTDLNNLIIRPVCNMHTLEDIIDLLKDATHFAVFNSTKSFFHVPLDDPSKQLMAMLTPIGILLYNVLAMGFSNATDILKHGIRQIVQGLKGVINIADDVPVFGRCKEEFQQNVLHFLDHCVQHDLHLNSDKIKIDVDGVPFFGQILTKDGLQIDEKKWEVIQHWPIPEAIFLR